MTAAGQRAAGIVAASHPNSQSQTPFRPSKLPLLVGPSLDPSNPWSPLFGEDPFFLSLPCWLHHNASLHCYRYLNLILTEYEVRHAAPSFPLPTAGRGYQRPLASGRARSLYLSGCGQETLIKPRLASTQSATSCTAAA